MSIDESIKARVEECVNTTRKKFNESNRVFDKDRETILKYGIINGILIAGLSLTEAEVLNDIWEQEDK